MKNQIINKYLKEKKERGSKNYPRGSNYCFYVSRGCFACNATHYNRNNKNIQYVMLGSYWTENKK